MLRLFDFPKHWLMKVTFGHLTVHQPELDKVLRDGLHEVAQSNLAIAAAIQNGSNELARIATVFERMVRPEGPSGLAINFNSQRSDDMGKVFMVGAVSWNAATDPDVDHFVLSVTRDGVADADVTFPAASTGNPIEAAVGVSLALSLNTVDAAGNPSASPMAIPAFTVTDTVGPQGPTGFQVAFTSQRTEA